MNILKKRKQNKELTVELNLPDEFRITINSENIILSVDEARALRDSLKSAIKQSDKENLKAINQTSYQDMPVQTYQIDEKKSEDFKLFPKNEKTPESRKTEFYY